VIGSFLILGKLFYWIVLKKYQTFHFLLKRWTTPFHGIPINGS